MQLKISLFHKIVHIDLFIFPCLKTLAPELWLGGCAHNIRLQRACSVQCRFCSKEIVQPAMQSQHKSYRKLQLSGYTSKHILMTIDHHVFYACPHFLSVSERKSRNNSFSILNLAISASKPSDFEGQPFFLWENSFFCISLLAIIATEKLMYLLRCNTYFVCYLFSRAAFWF